MSIEVVFHPRNGTRDQLRQLLRGLGFTPTEHLWDWPQGSLHYHWFSHRDYESFDGVEATIYPPSDEQKKKLGPCAWALHTRTRVSASGADKEQQNVTIRAARQRFGGSFYNDWYGLNRYTKIDDDPRDAAARGIYLAYELVTHNIGSVRFALPQPNDGLQKLVGTELETLAAMDPTRVLYNALVPFAVAALEHFFSQCFKILLRYEPSARERLTQQKRKVDIPDVLAIQTGERTLEDVVADWYSFQNIASIHSAFHDWFSIDVWKLLRRRRKIGKSLPLLERRLDQLIEFRHGIVHRFSLNLGLQKHQIEELLDLASAVIETFVDHLEKQRGIPIRE